MDKKSPDAFRTISEVAEWLGVPTHVLRFWESRFSQVKPVKRAGGRRYYRPNDMELLGGIRKLLHEDGMTIRGVQKLLREEGVKHVAAMSPPLDSDEMRDITPSNVVPLAGKSAPEERPHEDRSEDPVTATPPVEETASDASQPDPAPDQPDVADAQPEPSDEAATLVEHSEADPHFTRSEVDTPDESSHPTDDPVDEPTLTAPELPGLHGSSDSSDAAAPPEPAPKIDITHIPTDPGDQDATPTPTLTSALRRTRQTGTGARIAALQALADRLESLAAQMGRNPEQTP
ncbi:MerR family transcriptional regulator [Aliiroseovarius sp. F47248L]|uniref:MerR family transcriptional regulator n=1 Tax=Aliiroseovarius sp. F47248L TaxID=2926420 RepID=UPI001FF1AC3B|nr:MerR family transcriptional regulator [Aliiroseovarius sp. F47248L]MCK0139119.1 MerR family transcriptional regulator [Aliiroseovarius sp. F47248L]